MSFVDIEGVVQSVGAAIKERLAPKVWRELEVVTLGNESGVVPVPASLRQSKYEVYITFANGDTGTAVNTKTANKDGLEVWVGLPPVLGEKRLHVQDVFQAPPMDDNPPSVPLPAHAREHSLTEYPVNGGTPSYYASDPVWVDVRQLLSLAIIPSGGLTVFITHGFVRFGDALVWFDGDSLDLTSYVAGTPDKAVYALIEIDDTLTFTVTAGDEFDADLGTGLSDQLPDVTIGRHAIGFVCLANGQTEIKIEHIWGQAGLHTPPVNTALGATLIDLVSDEVGLTIQGHSTQTNELQVWEQSDGTDVANLNNDGDLDLAGDLGVAGHGALGADATVSTASTLVLDEVHTDDNSQAYFGLKNDLEIAADTVVNTRYNYGMYVTVKASGAQNHTGGLYGELFVADYDGTAILDVAQGIGLLTRNLDAGTITVARGLYISSIVNSGGGTITRAEGLLIGNINVAATNYAIRTYAGNIVFNNSKDANTDFQFNSNNILGMLFVDSSTDRVGVGTRFPGQQLHVYHASNNVTLLAESDGADSAVTLALLNDAQDWKVQLRGGSGDILVLRDDTLGEDRLKIVPGGELVLNDAGSDVDFRVEGNTDTDLLFVDAGNDEVNVGNFAHDGTTLGFYGTAGIAKQDASNLAEVLAALDAYGMINDTS